MDEKKIFAIIENRNDDLIYKKAQIELFFRSHPDEAERAEYLRSAYQDRFTEILADGARLGYRPQKNGLLMWEGAYLSRTSETVFSWGLVAGFTAQLIDKREYYVNTEIKPFVPMESQQLTAVLGADAGGNVTRIDNALEKITEHLANARSQLAHTTEQLENARTEMTAPFPKEAELAEKTRRLNELNVLLNLNEQDRPVMADEPDEGDRIRPKNAERER